MKVINNCISFVWALQQCASRFYDGLSNAHLLFMSLSKICITVYEGLSNLQLLWWAPQKCASQFEGLNNLHLRMHLRLNCKCSLSISAMPSRNCASPAAWMPNQTAAIHSAHGREELWWRRANLAVSLLLPLNELMANNHITSRT